MSEAVRYSCQGSVAVVTIDDGRANAFSHEVLDALDAALEAAAGEASAVVVGGRPGRFSAGFDLAVMKAGPKPCRDLVEKGARLMLKAYEYPRPIVTACSGHALAAGAVWLLATDWRIGADVDAKIGLNEVAIGMALPIFAVELARDRLATRHLLDAVAHARIFSPRQAVDAGYLDEVVAAESLAAAALAKAEALAALPDPAYRVTKRSLRRATLRLVRDTLDEDMDRIG